MSADELILHIFQLENTILIILGWYIEELVELFP
jgi:hypothetical protein